jgi:hypothetical protein
MTSDYKFTAQLNLCSKFGAQFIESNPETTIGISRNCFEGIWPLNGLRHPMEGNTNGWYIWAGTELSFADDFFSPMHTEHLNERIPLISKFLGLPPGWRFICDPNYEDVWFDESLLILSK